MKLWSIQTQKAWGALKHDETLKGEAEFIEQSFRPAYDWLICQMRLRLPNHPQASSLPIWAWQQWRSQLHSCPDLRCGGHLEKGAQGALLELEVSPDRVLLSDFDLWHFVLNYWYLPATVKEGEAFEQKVEMRGLSFYKSKPLPDTCLHEEIVRSWERIFDLEFTKADLAKPREEKSIQAALWELRLSDVESVREFTAR